jgi:hypothetical protein
MNIFLDIVFAEWITCFSSRRRRNIYRELCTECISPWKPRLFCFLFHFIYRGLGLDEPSSFFTCMEFFGDGLCIMPLGREENGWIILHRGNGVYILDSEYHIFFSTVTLDVFHSFMLLVESSFKYLPDFGN